jgi:Winged helix-turn helix
VADLIEQKFGVRLSLPTVGRILKKLGMSAQRPLYRAYQQDPEKVRIWKQETYPAIRAEAAEAGATRGLGNNGTKSGGSAECGCIDAGQRRVSGMCSPVMR